MMNSSSGRFLQTDPASYTDGANLYAYVSNDPLNYVDPTGLGAEFVTNPDNIQAGLDVAGLVPGVGIVPDLLNAGISVARGNYGAAALSAGAAIPIAGQFVTAGKVASKSSDELVDLYRAVGPAELSDIQSAQRFINRGSAEGKYFTSSAEDASDYARQAVRAFKDPPYTTVKTQIPRSKLPESVTVDGGIPAFVVPDSNLQGLVPEVLNSSVLPRRR